MSNNATFTGMPAMQFFDEYPVVYINGIGAATWKASAADAEGLGDLQVVSTNTRVSYCTIAPYNDPSGIGTVTTATNKQPTSFTISPNNPGGGIPLFYLPYALNHNRRMTLTDKQAVGGVGFFLTDLVDGCSVYIEGNPQKPSVYHINANKQLPRGMQNFSATDSEARKKRAWKTKWAHMDDRFRREGTIVKARGGQPIPGTPKALKTLPPGGVVPVAPLPNLQPASKVESRDYMLITRLHEKAFNGMLAGMQLTTRCPTLIGGQTVDEMEVIFTQGTIFGTLAGGNWSFWVQKRVLVQFFHRTPVAPAAQTTKQKAMAFFGSQPYTRTPLGTEWVVRGVHQFWPTVNTGRLVP